METEISFPAKGAFLAHVIHCRHLAFLKHMNTPKIKISREQVTDRTWVLGRLWALDQSWDWMNIGPQCSNGVEGTPSHSTCDRTNHELLFLTIPVLHRKGSLQKASQPCF